MSDVVIDRRGRRYRNTLLERTVLREVTRRARKLGAWIQGARTQRLDELLWRFESIHPPFVWQGLASNAFDARLKGWEAWMVQEWRKDHGVLFYVQTFGVGAFFYLFG